LDYSTDSESRMNDKSVNSKPRLWPLAALETHY
jgi:hypothetical protein